MSDEVDNSDPQSSRKKGNTLEAIVSKIESFILRSKNIPRDAIEIEKNRIFIIDGERYEIDVWISIDHGSGYNAEFAFECKNWSKKVGPKEILWFAAKLDRIPANKGYVVAKDYTSNAVLEAERNPRIELLRVDIEKNYLGPIPFEFHAIHNTEKKHAEVDFVAHDANNSGKRIEISNEALVIRKGGKQETVAEFMKPILEDLEKESISVFPSGNLSPGVHKHLHSTTLNFKRGELLVDAATKIDVKTIMIELELNIEVIALPVNTLSSIEGRGELWEFESTKIGSADIQFEIYRKPVDQ